MKTLVWENGRLRQVKAWINAKPGYDSDLLLATVEGGTHEDYDFDDDEQESEMPSYDAIAQQAANILREHFGPKLRIVD